jgi:hypothetical protein
MPQQDINRVSHTISSLTSQIVFFENDNQTYTLHLIDQANLTYALFLKNANIKLTITTENEGVKGQIFAFVIGDKTSLHVETKLQASHSSVKVQLIALQQEHTEVNIQGIIDIAP